MSYANKRKKKQKQNEQHARALRRDRYTDKKSWKKKMYKKVPFRRWKDNLQIAERSGEPGTIEKDPTEMNTYKFTKFLSGVVADPKDMPRGLDNLEIMNDLSQSLKRANDNNHEFAVIESKTHDFVVKTIFKNIPAVWGFNEHVVQYIADWKKAEDYEPPVPVKTDSPTTTEETKQKKK